MALPVAPMLLLTPAAEMAGDRETKAMGLGKQYKELRADAARLEQQARAG